MIHRFKPATDIDQDAYVSIIALVLCIIAAVIFKLSDCNNERIEEPITYEGSAIVANETLANEMIPVTDENLNELVEQVYLDEIESLRNYTSELEKRIISLQQTEARSTGRVITRTVETTVPANFEPIEQSIDLDFDSTIVPIGSVNLGSTGDLRIETFDLNLYLDNLTTRNDDDSMTTISRLTIETNGESYDIPIDSRTSYVYNAFTSDSVPGTDDPEPRQPRFLFRPNLNLNLSPAYSSDLSLVPSLGIGLMHLRTKDRTAIGWTFLSFNAGLNSNPGYFVLSLAPALYNIGLPLPLVNDLFIGPAIGIDYKANPYYILQIGTSL
jgi:hypothetical protein